jgi:hypothetical protein
MKLKEREVEMNTIKLNQEFGPKNTNRMALLLHQTYPQVCPSKRESHGHLPMGARQ